VIAWAGMRGVVTLAAAFVLPADTPQRAVLVLAAFVVVAGTLAVQGMTLPPLIRKLRLPRPDPAEDALQEAAVLHDMTRAALAKLEEIRTDDDPPEIIQRLRDRNQVLSLSLDQRPGIRACPVDQCQLDEKLGPDIPGVTGRPGQPGS